MYVTSRLQNIAFLGLLVSLCLLSALGFVIAEEIVDTDPRVVLEVRTRGILPCRIQRRGYGVEWKRQLSSGSELLVSLDTYFNVGARDGQGYKAGLFNITDDYSLFIKDVKVKDEGLYICSFFDYQTGKAFRNSTRVSVQAFPDEPFPTIRECIGNFLKPGVCTLTIHSTSNLSCLVEGYYPDIDLFFLRGFEKVTPSAYEEWNNTDGTKNNIITIQISVSDEPYQCVASKLSGTAGNRSVSVIVQAPSEGPSAAAIVVPVLIAVGMVCMVGICLLIRYHGNGRGWCSRHDYIPVPRGPPIKAPKGPISKLELWELVTNAKENGAFNKLCQALRRLLNIDTLTLKNELHAYENLCTWKSETSSHLHQRGILYSVCCEIGMVDITKNLIDFVKNPSHEVTRLNIEHILWEIGDTRKIIELLKVLGLDDEEGDIESQMRREEVIDMARIKLLTWLKHEHDINPMVTLSLKLDDIHCQTNFFKTPKGPISKLELWILKTYATEKKALKNLCEAVRRLLNTDALTLQNDLFGCLCTWKSETSSNCNQRDTLYSACCEAGMSDIVRKMIDFVADTSHKVSRMHIEHILREIDDTMKITELLKAFGLDHEALAKASEKGRRSVVIDMARMELLKWRDRDFDINPLVTLSLKLDNLHCQSNFYKFPEGPISKLELWKLITSAKENGAFEKLSKVIRRLHRPQVKTEKLTLQTDVDFYESLCIWKSQTSSNCNQREKLYSLCCKEGMADIIKKMIDSVMDASHKVSRDDLEHILQEISDTRKITELLKALGLDHDEVPAAGEKGERKVMDTAREKLLKWQDQELYIDPLVTLCMKLEDLHCEIEFFK